jgi:hypothetical protein
MHKKFASKVHEEEVPSVPQEPHAECGLVSVSLVLDRIIREKYMADEVSRC